MWERVTYAEKAAVPCMNEVEVRVRESSPGGDVLDLEVDVLRRAPCGDWSCIDAPQRAAITCYGSLDAPMSSPLNLT